jgi:hypothetical protein
MGAKLEEECLILETIGPKAAATPAGASEDIDSSGQFVCGHLLRHKRLIM